MNIDKEQSAIEVLRFFGEKTGLLVAYSGGKDSDVLLHLAIKSKIPIKVVHSHTTVDAPETVYYVRETFKRLTEQGIGNYIEYPKETMWQLIVKNRMPPTRLARYCCSALKEQTGAGEKIATGVRWAESRNRRDMNGLATIKNATNKEKAFADGDSIKQSNKGGVIVLNLDNAESREIVESCFRTRKVLINPIVDWSDDDVWQYIRQEGMKVNPLYDCGSKRIGCIGCPMAGKLRHAQFARYPKYKDMYIRAFQRMVDKRIQDGMPTDAWKTGKDVFHWWIEDGVMPGQLELEGYEI